MPSWQLDILLSEQARVEARALRMALTAASVPHLDKDARQRLVRSVDRMADVPRPAAPTLASQGVYDPEAAARWFAEQGVQTV